MRAILTDLGVAACLIKNEAILLVKEASGPQKGRWGMPKGTVDEGELPSFAALRELEEECGISDLSIIRFLKYTYHTYSIDEKKILKITSWYLMSSKYEKKLIPQLSEGITHVEWVRPENINTKLENSFNNIIDLFNDI